MADLVFNISKGRVAELYNRVKSQDPSASRLYVDVFSGSVTDATLKDCDDIAACVTAGLTRLTSNGWATKTLDNTVLNTVTPDDTNDRMDLDIADQTWTAVTSGTSTRLIISYASVASPTTSQLLPLTSHDFAVTPDGSDVTVVINAAGFFRAS